MNEELEPRAVGISRRIVASNQSRGLRGVDRSPDFWPWPSWYVDLVIKLDVIDVAEPILYLSSSLTTDSPAGGELFALTDHLAVHAAVVDVQKNCPQVDVSIWSRSELKELKIVSAENTGSFDLLGLDEVPVLSLELRYADKEAIALPCGTGASRDRNLGAIYPNLLSDIR